LKTPITFTINVRGLPDTCKLRLLRQRFIRTSIILSWVAVEEIVELAVEETVTGFDQTSQGSPGLIELVLYGAQRNGKIVTADELKASRRIRKRCGTFSPRIDSTRCSDRKTDSVEKSRCEFSNLKGHTAFAAADKQDSNTNWQLLSGPKHRSPAKEQSTAQSENTAFGRIHENRFETAKKRQFCLGCYEAPESQKNQLGRQIVALFQQAPTPNQKGIPPLGPQTC
jgi:hypothetical protein